MTKVAIIGGTGFYKMAQGQFLEREVSTPYGPAQIHEGLGEHANLIFLARHGAGHHIPPHKINYRANMKALSLLGVERIMAVFTVGSLHRDIPPSSLVLLDQFIDFTHGREGTFFDGGETGLAHAEMNQPYCSAIRSSALAVAASSGVSLQPRGTYVCTQGPRFETPAEIHMFASWGGDVVGMTGVPEVALARELGMHYAAVALSVNWAAGLEESIAIVSEGMDALRASVLRLFLDTLSAGIGDVDCECRSGLMVMHPPMK